MIAGRNIWACVLVYDVFVIMYIMYSVYRCDELVWECIALCAIGGSPLDLYTPKVQETRGHVSSVVLHSTDLPLCCRKGTGTCLQRCVHFSACRGVVRRAPHPGTMVSIMVRDTHMSGLSNGSDTCCVFAGQGHWTLTVSLQ